MKRLLALSSLAAFSLTACQAGADTIQIGYIGPLTGEAAPYGADTLHGAELRVQEINEAGGIDGYMLELIAEDGKCAGSDAASAAQKLTTIDGVVAIIGGQCSGETLAAAPIAEGAQTILISPASSSPDISEAGDFVFRNYPSDSLKTTAMAGYFVQSGVTNVAMISENSDFTSAFRESLLGELPEGTIVFDETVEPSTKDYRTLFTRLQGTEFDAFFPNGQTPAVIAAMVQQFREAGFTQPIISHDVADSAALLELAGDAVEGMRVINVPNAGEGGTFETAFTDAYGDPEQALGFAAHSYDAVGVIAEAIAAVGTDGTALRDYLYDLDVYNGVVGNFTFDDNGDVRGVAYVLREVQNGAFATIADITVE